MLHKILQSFIFFLFYVPLSAQVALDFRPFVAGLTDPVALVSAGDDRLFVVQQRGLIRILDLEGNLSDAPFLDLSGVVSQSGSETGLLGLAFHPEYHENGYFFVNYTRASDGNTVVSRFSVDENNPNLAGRENEIQLLTVNQPYSNHNGGQLLFGPDGYLYIAPGDGGSGGNPNNNAQNRNILLGKILRIDVDAANETGYGIPPDNPFADDESARSEIWAWGVRNPWRKSFDRLTGDFWIADVGPNSREEINFQSAGSPGGENYGWRCYEGNQFELDNTEEGVYAVQVTHPENGCTDISAPVEVSYHPNPEREIPKRHPGNCQCPAHRHRRPGAERLRLDAESGKPGAPTGNISLCNKPEKRNAPNRPTLCH